MKASWIGIDPVLGGYSLWGVAMAYLLPASLGHWELVMSIMSHIPLFESLSVASVEPGIVRAYFAVMCLSLLIISPMLWYKICLVARPPKMNSVVSIAAFMLFVGCAFIIGMISIVVPPDSLVRAESRPLNQRVYWWILESRTGLAVIGTVIMSGFSLVIYAFIAVPIHLITQRNRIGSSSE
ncbi:MAG: hypothetical protein ACREXR_02915 [Gammaproteobacteria bacterium]